MYSAGLNFCLPALVLSEAQLNWTLQGRASLKILTAICVVTPGVQCLQTVRAIQGWTHPVSQLEKPVMNHQGLMNAVLRIMHGCRRQHPNSPPEMSWLLSIFLSCLGFFFFSLKYANEGTFPSLRVQRKVFVLGPWLCYDIWFGRAASPHTNFL